MPEHLIIIGAGPAGYTAAIYAARANLSPLLFEGPEPGGQLTSTTAVENFPGFPDGIQGPELMQIMRKQAERFGARLVGETVESVDVAAAPFSVRTNGGTYQAEAVILSMGASARWLGVPGEKEYKGRGVSACATCDAPFFRGKDVLVVGGGDAAMEEADDLAKFAASVRILVRTAELRASPIMQERAKANSKISFLWNTEAKEVVGDGAKMTGVKTLNNKTNEMAELKADGLFLAIGHQPNTGLLQGQPVELGKGYVMVKPGTTQTNVPGVFAAGDVADWTYRQAITAAGTGCMAALDAQRFLAHGEK